MLPGVLPPLVWELGSYLVEEAFRAVFDDLGVLPDSLVGRRGLVRRVRGRAAMDFSILRAVADTLPGAGPDQLEEQYFGSRRSDRAVAGVGPRRHHVFRSGLHDIRVLRARRRSVFDAELAIRAVAEIDRAPVDLAALSERALQSYQLRLIDLATRAMRAELSVAADAAATYRALELALARYLGAVDAGRLTARLTTAPNVTAAPSPRASAAVFAGPTWSELGLGTPVRAERAHADDAEPLDDVVQALEATPRWRNDGLRSWVRLRTIRRLTGDAVDQLTRRERTKAAVLLLGGELRRVHLELGARLAARGVLETALDIDLLSPEELRHSVEGHSAPTPEAIIRRRRWLLRYEAEGPLPARFSGIPDPVVIDVPSGRRFEGWAASAGRITGRAQVLRSPTEFLERDAVLVAEATDPSWSPVFMRAGAIVLERGGPLSHAAILARELGIPAVLNLPGATHVLGGKTVSVDGDSGIVVVLNDNDRVDAP
jgi:pyruvate,water dikinase